jgi:hypothetical protein
MEKLIRPLCTFWQDDWQGIYLVKIHYEQTKIDNDFSEISYQKSFTAGRILTFTSKKVQNGKPLQELTAYMIKPLGTKSSPASVTSCQDTVFWRSFSAGEVWAYSEKVSDRNQIHLGDRPIVQGFFLFEEIIRTFPATQNCQMTFHTPIRAGTPIFLTYCEKSGTFQGHHKGILYFSGTLAV